MIIFMSIIDKYNCMPESAEIGQRIAQLSVLCFVLILQLNVNSENKNYS